MPDARPKSRTEVSRAAAAERNRPHLVAQPPPERTQEISAIAMEPVEHVRLQRHNARVGSPLQRVVMRFLLIYLFGPPAWLIMRLLFRIRVDNPERFDVLCKGPGIFAVRHFYEVDPLVSFYAAAWTRAVRYPQLAAFSLASRVWTRSVLLRGISWCLGVMGLSRGLGARQSATERAVELLERPETNCAIIYPTGPVGMRTRYSIGPGLGFLASSCPELPVLPVTMVGLQEFRWRDLLLLRRPQLHYAVCRPFYGGDLPGPTEAWRIEQACELLAQRWTEEENRIRGVTA
jgi:hypothetical protein